MQFYNNSVRNLSNVMKQYMYIFIYTWWTATRNEIVDYAQFKKLFKEKYWSEAIQNIIRDNICQGRYDGNRGTSPTTVSYTHLLPLNSVIIFGGSVLLLLD